MANRLFADRNRQPFYSIVVCIVSLMCVAESAASEARSKFELDSRIMGIAVCDMEMDGKSEIVAMASHDLYIVRMQNTGLYIDRTIPGRSYHRYLSVDAADVNQNGRPEIFVSCLSTASDSLESFVLEWDGKDITPIVTDVGRYFRVVRDAGGRDRLLAQKKGIDKPFFPGIDELIWNGSAYERTRTIPMPDDIAVAGITCGRLMHDRIQSPSSMVFAAFDSDDRILLIDGEGTEIWKSPERYGGSETYLSFGGKNDRQRVYFPQRILTVDGTGKSATRWVTVKNNALTGRLLKRFRNFQSGYFECFEWNGADLVSRWTSDNISGYIADFAADDMDGDGSRELIAAVIKDRGELFTDTKSLLLIMGGTACVSPAAKSIPPNGS